MKSDVSLQIVFSSAATIIAATTNVIVAAAADVKCQSDQDGGHLRAASTIRAVSDQRNKIQQHQADCSLQVQRRYAGSQADVGRQRQEVGHNQRRHRIHLQSKSNHIIRQRLQDNVYTDLY